MYTWGYIKESALSKLDLNENEVTQKRLLNKFPYWANEVITQVCSSIKPKYSFAKFVITKDDIGELKTMPDDFVSFSDDVSTRTWHDEYNDTWLTACTDEERVYKGYNQIVFYKEGTYNIAYNARWYTFSSSMSNYTEIDVPTDILECIPLYIASQGYKLDDEYKSSVFRNEYEMALARIDNTHFKQTSTFRIAGDW